MHHNVDQKWVQWCDNRELVDSVHCFVFVSHWQREQYLAKFDLPSHRCVVLRHALDLNPEPRRWETRSTWRCAYTSTPFRGLSVLLDAWQRLSPRNAELHIWSSMKLYLGDDGPYQHLFDQARSMPGRSVSWPRTQFGTPKCAADDGFPGLSLHFRRDGLPRRHRSNGCRLPDFSTLPGCVARNHRRLCTRISFQS